ncbi:MAG: hypothetical protein NZV14_01935 [Bryobacteraceae bacterium]|nr:hypothetical protein [Bryobacteraceae bacterium]MDW8376889.1 hypothetical protein [Bryobacterales bacterium]
MNAAGLEHGYREKRWSSWAVPLDFAWALAGNLASSASQWLSIVLLARLGSPDLVGQYALALAVTSPIFLLAGCNLRTIQATDVPAATSWSTYWAIRLLTSTLAALVTGVVVCWGSYSRTATHAILILAAAKFFDSLADTVYGQLQRCERMDRIAISMILRAVLSLAGLSAGLQLTLSAAAAAAGVLLASVLVLWLYDVPSLKLAIEPSVGAKFRLLPTGRAWMGQALSVMRLALPMGVLMALVAVNAYLPRYWLARALGEHELGVFAAISYISLAANLAIMALGQVLSSRLARLHVARESAGFRRWSLVLGLLAVLVGTVSVLVAWLWGETVLEFLYGAPYRGFGSIFVCLMISGAFSYTASACGYVLSSVRCFVPQIPLLIATTLTMMIAMSILVPRYGLTGAALAQASGYALQTVLTLTVAVRIYREISNLAPS